MLALWCLRTVVFRLYESPRYLVARGEDEKAIAVLHAVARENGVECSLTVEQLRQAGTGAVAGTGASPLLISKKMGLTSLAKWSFTETWIHVKALFATRKIAWSTSLLIFLWGEYTSLLPSSVDVYSPRIQG